MTDRKCDRCNLKTPHDAIAHLTPSGALKASRDARKLGRHAEELAFLAESKRLSNRAKRDIRRDVR